MRIVIVDDNAAMRKVLVAIFSGAGHEVVGAFEDGQELEDRIRTLRPDLVCLDYNLPGRDGLTLLRAIQTAWPQLDVVFMTGSSESNIEEKAADAGASGFLRKPFGQAQIVEELRAVEETRRIASQAALPSLEVARPATGGKRRRGTAVIADDNGSVRLVLKALLEECGLTVVQSVANGSEAIQAAKNHQPSVFCLDVNMPVMDGLEALPKIVESSPQSHVIMVTGCADKKLVAQAAGLGAVGYILKPLRPAYVENFIRKLLGG
ncbi:MAG: response regulator [Bacteroidota bacterium]